MRPQAFFSHRTRLEAQLDLIVVHPTINGCDGQRSASFCKDAGISEVPTRSPESNLRWEYPGSRV